MIAPYVPGSIVISRWRERNARRTVTQLPPILSTIAAGYNNRRAFSGFSLEIRLPEAHPKRKED